MATITELANNTNIKNWAANHNDCIAPPSKTEPKEYIEAVKKLLNAVKKNPIDEEATKALKDMYIKKKYYTKPILMTEAEFHKIIDEFTVGNFSNLEKLKTFLTKSGTIYHLDYMANNYCDLRELYAELRFYPTPRTVSLIEKLLKKMNLPPDDKIEELCEEIKKKNYKRVKKIAENYNAQCIVMSKAYDKCIDDLPWPRIKYTLACEIDSPTVIVFTSSSGRKEI